MVIISQNGNSAIVNFDKNGKASTILNIPYSSQNAIDSKGNIFILDLKKKELQVYNTKGDLIAFNNQYDCQTIAIKEDILYMGGHCKKKVMNKIEEIFAVVSIREIDFGRKQIELPVRKVKLPVVFVAGKSIDDILIVDNLLILVDNIVMPKYNLYFDITTPDNPTYIETELIQDNGTYEHIHKGEINEDWMALLSSTVGRSGNAWHIRVGGKTEGVLTVTNQFRQSARNDDRKNRVEKRNMLFGKLFEDSENDLSFENIQSDVLRENQKEDDGGKASQDSAATSSQPMDEEVVNRYTFNDICLINNNLYFLVNHLLYSVDLNSLPTQYDRGQYTYLSKEKKETLRYNLSALFESGVEHKEIEVSKVPTTLSQLQGLIKLETAGLIIFNDSDYELIEVG